MVDNMLQKMLGVKIEYNSGLEKMKIDTDVGDGSFYADLDEIVINPKIVNLHNVMIKKKNVKVDFNTPVICNPDSAKASGSMMVGVKFEGVDKYSFVEKIEEVARSFGPEWEDAVEKRKMELKGRNNFLK